MPLESNPDALNKYIKNLGVADGVQFYDVYGFDPELLCMVPQPCQAIILLFPITQAYEDYCIEEALEIEKKGQVVSENVFYMKQTIGNACGTIGVLHALANCRSHFKISSGSAIEKFLENSSGLSPDDIGKSLETNENIQSCHSQCAHEGQSETISADTNVNLHFVAFVHVDGCLYELDGRKKFPINHGQSSKETFLTDAVASCKKFMLRNPNDSNFSVIALSEGC